MATLTSLLIHCVARRHVVPAGSVITVESTTFNGDKLIGVVWADKHVKMFTQDIRARGEARLVLRRRPASAYLQPSEFPLNQVALADRS